MFNKVLSILLAGLIFISGLASAEEPDWNDYRAVLTQVKPGTKNGIELMLVDYPALKADENLDKAYQALSSFDPKRLSGRDEQLAFYINAYNMLALKTIVDHWPIDSIKDVGSLLSPVWDKPAGELGGKTVSLGEVEHKVLRPMGEPRIHLAIVCASVSCPDLRDDPYTASKLSAQLDDQARRFLDNPGKGLIAGKDKVQVSQIFDWFEKDFVAVGGVTAFIKHYKTDMPDLKIKTNIDYDWTVNSSR